jgi:hypothetical protein
MYNGYRIYNGKVSAPKKNCEGFPMFLPLKNSKTALIGDVKQ